MKKLYIQPIVKSADLDLTDGLLLDMSNGDPITKDDPQYSREYSNDAVSTTNLWDQEW